MNAKRNIAVFAVVAVAWVVLDRVAKGAFADMTPGQSLGPALGGLVDLRLVHNTGAAWGIFADSTVALGVFSLAVVAVLVVYFALAAKTANLAQVVGIALVAGGGIGNAIDRFAQGYVTDFIAVTFIDFPVFNVADIGVTCGVVLLFVGLLASWRKDSEPSK